MSNFKTSLHNESIFYSKFINDLNDCKSEVIIESPFITTKRMKTLFPVLNQLNNRGVKVFIITRDSKEYKSEFENQSETEIEAFEDAGIQVLLSNGNYHQIFLNF